MNRNIEPSIAEISRPSLWEHQQITLPNGIEIVYLHDPNQEVFKMDVILAAGIYNQSRPVIASSMINMLNEGTRQHSSAEIAELFDYHGAYVDFNCGIHKAELSLISLNKYASQTIRMLAEMTLESTFPQKELETYIRNRKQQHLVNIEKTSYLARMEFIYRMYGKAHPYANCFTLEDFDQVTPELLLDFYQKRVQASQCRIMICGNVSDTVLQEVSQAFSLMSSNPVPPDKTYTIQPSGPGKYHISKPDAVQTSIRIGKKGVTLLDEDYTYFQLLNMVLGGYFGSRLMSNIREEKGYTYGIQSFNVSLPLTAYWGISTDVDNKHTRAAIDEILKEIEKIRQEPIPSDELNRVKSFFYGDLLREIDGVFSQADSLKQKLIYGKDNRFYIDIIDRVKHCTPDELQELAQRYLDPAELYIVTAGKTI